MKIKTLSFILMTIMLQGCVMSHICKKIGTGRVHIEARSNLLSPAYIMQIDMFYSVKKEKFTKSVFLDTIIYNKSLKNSLINGLKSLEKDSAKYEHLDTKVVCTIPLKQRNKWIIVFQPHQYIYVKYMKRNDSWYEYGQMYKWDEGFYENIKCYIPYKYP